MALVFGKLIVRVSIDARTISMPNTAVYGTSMQSHCRPIAIGASRSAVSQCFVMTHLAGKWPSRWKACRNYRRRLAGPQKHTSTRWETRIGIQTETDKQSNTRLTLICEADQYAYTDTACIGQSPMSIFSLLFRGVQSFKIRCIINLYKAIQWTVNEQDRNSISTAHLESLWSTYGDISYNIWFKQICCVLSQFVFLTLKLLFTCSSAYVCQTDDDETCMRQNHSSASQWHRRLTIELRLPHALITLERPTNCVVHYFTDLTF